MLIQILILEQVYLSTSGIFFVAIHCKTKQITRPYYSVLINIQKQPPLVFYKKGVHENFAKLMENCCTRVSFLNKIAGLSLQLCLKRDSDTVVFLQNSRNFSEQFCLQNTSGNLLLNIYY